MRRWLLIFVCLVFAVTGSECRAQWYRNYGGYGGGYGGGGGTAYSYDAQAAAALTIARGTAAQEYAQARQTNELARSQYIDNLSKYQEIRRQQNALKEADKEKQKEETQARAALRPAPKTATQLYPRLSADQLDLLTGAIQWPESVQGSDYADDRKAIEAALQSQAEYGANDRSAKIMFDAAHRMMKTLSGDYGKLGPENYASDRRFLNSLSVEGSHALEALK